MCPSDIQDARFLKVKCNFIFVNMLQLIYKCTNTLYDYAIINY